MDVKIRFCLQCGTAPLVAAIQEAVQNAFGIDVRAEYVLGSGFDVVMDDVILYSKDHHGRLPEVGQIVALIAERTAKAGLDESKSVVEEASG